MFSSNILGEESLGSFYPDQGWVALNNMIHQSPESISNYTILDEKGKTLVPIKLYFKNGIIKIQFAIAKGRKNRDKRNYKKDKEIKREIDRGLKGTR